MRFSGDEPRASSAAGGRRSRLGFAHYLDGELVGHTSFLNDRPEDRVVEIGNTWLNPTAWGTGANTEAKYLLLRHAFEDEGYLRVEFKTDADERALAPGAREGAARRSRASSASTCSCAAASGATRRGTR